MFNNVQWVVQKNITYTNDLAELREACKNVGVHMIEIEMIPFNEHLPEFDKTKASIFYGSTTLCKLAYDDEQLKKGVFFDTTAFSIENYIKRWGRHMLNSEALITTIEGLSGAVYEPGKLLFIRPDDDSKSFAGEVISFNNIKDWYENIKNLHNTDLLQSKIVISEPYNIQYEWRLWIVNKKVVAASKYREYFKLTKERGCPPEAIDFAEKRCREYTPAEIFVMDVCFCGDEYFVVECGCMNGAGFYAADIGNIVGAVTEYFAEYSA